MLQSVLDRKSLGGHDSAEEEVFQEALFGHRRGLFPTTFERFEAVFQVTERIVNVGTLTFDGLQLFQLLRQNPLFTAKLLEFLGDKFDAVGIGIHFGLEFKSPFYTGRDFLKLLLKLGLATL